MAWVMRCVAQLVAGGGDARSVVRIVHVSAAAELPSCWRDRYVPVAPRGGGSVTGVVVPSDIAVTVASWHTVLARREGILDYSVLPGASSRFRTFTAPCGVPRRGAAGPAGPVTASGDGDRPLAVHGRPADSPQHRRRPARAGARRRPRPARAAGRGARVCVLALDPLCGGGGLLLAGSLRGPAQRARPSRSRHRPARPPSPCRPDRDLPRLCPGE